MFLLFVICLFKVFFVFLSLHFRLDFTALEKEAFFLEVMTALILFSYPSMYYWSGKMFIGLSAM